MRKGGGRLTKGPVEILLVEDDDWDAKVTMEAFAKADLPIRMNRLVNGAQVMPYLCREGVYSASTRPDLILLDLNLPRKDGRDVLAQLKQDPSFRRIPVLVLTTSRNELDIARAYDLHANAYLNKPFEPDEYASVVKSIEEFWFVWTVRPSG